MGSGEKTEFACFAFYRKTVGAGSGAVRVVVPVGPWMNVTICTVFARSLEGGRKGECGSEGKLVCVRRVCALSAG